MPSFEKFQMKRKTLQKPVITREIYSYTQRDALILEKEAVLKEKGEASGRNGTITHSPILSCFSLKRNVIVI